VTVCKRIWSYWKFCHY